MNRINNQRGIALLELLVGLAIMALIASVAMPTIIPDSGRHSLEKDAQEVRFALQNLLRDSWLSGKTFQVIPAAKGQWSVLTRQQDEWQEDHFLFEDIDNLTYALTTENASNEASLAQGRIYFLSSGEYTPFTLRISKGDFVVSVVGDGTNDIQIK